MKTILALLLVSLASSVAQVSVVRPVSREPELSFYPGDAAIPVQVEAPADATVSLVYDLMQVGGGEGGVGAMLASDQSAGDRLAMDGRTQQNTEAVIRIPTVKRPTTMIVRFRVADPPIARKSPFDTVSLRVFPRPAPGEWRDALASAQKLSGRSLAVFGPSPSLRSFFKAHDIAFEDLGEEFPSSFRPDLLTLAEVTAETFDNRRPVPSQGAQIFFVKDASDDLPGVYQTRSPSGSVAKVTLPLTADLDTLPARQADLMHLLLANLAPTTP